MGTIRGVLLDVDGTLVDSNDAHAHAWVEALSEHGVEVPYEKVRPLIGMGGDKLLPRVAGIEENSEAGAAIGRRRREIFLKQYVPSLTPLPGAEQLLLRMRDSGLMLVVATSAKRDELDPLLEICGAKELIDRRTSADDAGNSKPDPDIVNAALKRSRLKAIEAVMIGDTPYDVAAASKAGVPVIAVRCGGWNDRDLEGAREIYDNPSDILTRYESSLLARSVAAKAPRFGMKSA